MRAAIAVAATETGLDDDTAFDGNTLVRGVENEYGGAVWFARRLGITASSATASVDPQRAGPRSREV